MSEPGGPQHHGVYASLVETTASVGAWLAVEDRGQQVVASGQVRLWHVADHPEGWRSR